MSKITSVTHGRPLIIGGGRMGMALAEGWAKNGIDRARITIIEPDSVRREYIASQHFSVAPSLAELSQTPFDVTLLAIKPQNLPELAPQLGAFLVGKPGHLLLSILAGTRLAQLAAIAPQAAIVRAMPNTPALIGHGITACIASATCSPSLRMNATELLAAVGDVVWLGDEAQMDAATALSGSGPAYVYYFLECLIEAGIAQGLPAEVARHLALATLTGSGILATEAKESLAELRRNVTSPGGTTQAALEVLMHPASGLAPLVAATLDAAARRATELAHS
jgi:pyrroline-5-carboxylate reductase